MEITSPLAAKFTENAPEGVNQLVDISSDWLDERNGEFESETDVGRLKSLTRFCCNYALFLHRSRKLEVDRAVGMENQRNLLDDVHRNLFPGMRRSNSW